MEYTRDRNHFLLSPLPPRKSNTHEAYARLREAILAGSLPPGKRLYERELAAQLGVSRTPVREALAMLESEGIVISAVGSGTVVREVTAEEVVQTYDVRVQLESYAAALAAARISSGELENLKAVNRRMTEILQAGFGIAVPASSGAERTELSDLNAEFHRIVAAASGNAILERTIASLLDTPLYARAYFWFTPRHTQESIAMHDQLLEHLAAGRAEESADCWRGHLMRGRDHILEGLQSGASLVQGGSQAS